MTYSLSIRPTSSTPKYRQIVNGIVHGIQSREIGERERLPSINAFSLEYDVSRDTVEKAYRKLKEQGFIISVPGKGYYTSCSAHVTEKRILLLINKLSSYKKVIIEGLADSLGLSTHIDIQLYHEDLALFERILRDNVGKFTDYVIVPSFKGSGELCAAALINDLLARERIWVLNTKLSGLSRLGGEVYQDYEYDIYTALDRAQAYFRKYEKVTLVFPATSNYSRGIIRGFARFCVENALRTDIIYRDFKESEISAGRAYIVILEDDLVWLVKKMRENRLLPGKDVGILAYNDSPLKEVLMEGISVISTDHFEMGVRLGKMIREEEGGSHTNEFNLILRNSL